MVNIHRKASKREKHEACSTQAASFVVKEDDENADYTSKLFINKCTNKFLGMLVVMGRTGSLRGCRKKKGGSVYETHHLVARGTSCTGFG